MTRRLRLAACALSACLLAACGGGGAAGPVTPTPVPVPVPPPPPVTVEPDFSAVQAEIDRHPVQDMAFVLGDGSGALFSYAKGDFAADTSVNIASATKLITGLAVWGLVEDGTLEQGSRPQDWLGFWSDLPGDARRNVDLSQLMSFTSGFNARPGAGCPGDAATPLSPCVESIHDGGLDSEPGAVFSYGPEHMQIAAAMARAATGEDLKTTVRRRVLDTAGADAGAGFRSVFGDNPRYAAGMIASADDYGRVLTALLDGRLVGDLSGFLADRTANATVAFQPAANSDGARDWHYGFGFWKECDAVPYQPSCDDAPTLSSPGAFGFLPWVDFGAGYWAVIAMREEGGGGVNPAAQSIALEQILQPMIENALADAAP